uniref:NPC intracellular cholesterol transporter 2 n=1 Tax=Monopterus albus TaxID=43700 RepID=A0A3Q3IRT4_MONAL|nr:epididymal secretory protein E1 [Monopterus albus]
MDVRTGLIVLFCLIGLNCALPVKFVDCDSPSGKALIVDITPCDVQPCALHIGQSYTVNVTFSSAVQSETSKAYVYGMVAGIPVPFPIPENDGCKSGVTCPIQMKQIYHYVATLPIKPEYPTIKVTVKWELSDANNQDLFCIKFPLQIVQNQQQDLR